MAYLRELEHFDIKCKSLLGPTCAQLTQEMHGLGRRVYYGGSHTRWWLRSFQFMDQVTRYRYEGLLQCGCQACLGCLHRAGKLPEGSIVPRK